MPYLLNAIYLLVITVFSPWLLVRVFGKGKRRRGLWQKLWGVAPRPAGPTAWFHGVSVGEIHSLRQVVAGFRRRRPDWQCVISTTTDTGFDEACKAFPDLCVFFWPFDFSWAVRRALQSVRPKLLVLAEGELWPDFLREAKASSVQVVVINGRLSPRSLARYQRLGRIARRLFAQIDLCAAQTIEYAEAYRTLGLPMSRVAVTGSVKFDGVSADRKNAKTGSLARLFNVRDSDLVWVAGSTQAPEEQVALDAYRRLRDRFPNLRLFLVPRQKDRFDEVARLLEQQCVPYVRRSSMTQPTVDRDAVLLIDTIGELSAIWGLADVAFVGGSLDGRRGGQNMIEPAAYGAAVVFGPHVWNFRDTARRLVERGAAVQVADGSELESAVEALLADKAVRSRCGELAKAFVAAQQGATERTLDLLDRLPVAA